MSLEVHCITTGRWRQNGYVIAGADGDALLVDPGAEPEVYQDWIDARELRPLAILITHAHFDHIGAAAILAERYGAPILLHPADRRLLRQANFFRRLFDAAEPMRVPDTVQELPEEASELVLGAFQLSCVPTPGHTEGSVCFRIQDELFAGDTILRAGFGRVDLPGGSSDKLRASVAVLQTLPPDLLVRPGHGEPFRLGDQLRHLLEQGPDAP